MAGAAYRRVVAGQPGAAAGARPDPRRLVAVLAALSLLAGLFASWRLVETVTPAGSVVVAVGFALALLAVVAALSVPARHLPRLDVALLTLAILLFLAEHAQVLSAHHTGTTDEARLGHGALGLLLAGQDPYAARIPERAGTHLITGGVVTHYSYPPLMLELGWLLGKLSVRLGQPWVITVLAVAGTAIVLFRALPSRWRTIAIPVIFGFDLFSDYANNGFPALLALPLLCLAAYRWTAIGAGGRLRRRGMSQAVALGLAASAHQLAWFLAAFLVVAIWVARCGELSRARATLVTARFTAAALGAFAAANLPFILWNAHSWLTGVLSVFVQQAKPYGAGLILVAMNTLGHCADLRYLSYATGVLTVTFLAMTAVGLRRIALAVPVLASIAFLLGARSDVEYFVVFVPLWLVWAATAEVGAIAASRPVRPPDRVGPVLTSPWRRWVAAVVAVLPAAALAAVPLVASTPVSVSVPAAVRAGVRLVRLPIRVRNDTAAPVRMTFSVGARGHGHPWRAVRGPNVLAPGHAATLLLVPERAPIRVSAAWRVTVFTARPPAFDSAAVPVLSAHHGGSFRPMHRL